MLRQSAVRVPVPRPPSPRPVTAMEPRLLRPLAGAPGTQGQAPGTQGRAQATTRMWGRSYRWWPTLALARAGSPQVTDISPPLTWFHGVRYVMSRLQTPARLYTTGLLWRSPESCSQSACSKWLQHQSGGCSVQWHQL